MTLREQPMMDPHYHRFTRFSHQLGSPSPTITQLWQNIPLMPISLRKVLVDVCQLSEDVDTNVRLLESTQHFFSRWHVILLAEPHPAITEHTFSATTTELARSSEIVRSITWMMLRSLPVVQDSDESAIRKEGFAKEMAASSTEYAEGMRMNGYRWIAEGDTGTVPPSIELPLMPSWRKLAEGYAFRLRNMVELLEHSLQFPVVQRRKNVSTWTAGRMLDAGWEGVARECRTVDLEVHYAHTGEQIGGMCEMRSAWRFNDLKPRYYYCIGGDHYWPSRYMRPVAVAFMNLNTLTSTSRRSNPDRIRLHPDSNFAIWDYSSFTTTLSELKFFLYYVGRFLMEDPYVVQHPLYLFDYRRGIVSADLGEMLMEYNEKCNILGEFSVHRLVDQIGLDADPTEVFHQRNNGMLGVAGNIGFSTSLHGVIMSAAISSDAGVGLGDDALGDFTGPAGAFWRHLALFGRVHPQKGLMVQRGRDEMFEEVFKFTKRRLEIHDRSVELFHLFDIPIIAYILDWFPDDRTIHDTSYDTRRSTFLTSWGSLLWRIHQLPHLVDDDDLAILRSFGRQAYTALAIPKLGALPGSMRRRDNPKLLCYDAAPPIVESFDPRTGDWAEYLYDTMYGNWFSLPLTSPSEIPLPEYLAPGSSILVTGSKYVSVLEDLGVLGEKNVLTDIRQVDGTNRREFLKSLKGGSTGRRDDYLMVRYRVMRDAPAYHTHVIARISQEIAVPHVDLEAEQSLEHTMYGGYTWNLI